MTGPIDFSGLCPSGYDMSLLAPRDFPEIVSLYQSVCQDLPAHQQTFVYKPRDESLDHVADGKGDLIGVRLGRTGQIIGAALVAYPADSSGHFGLARRMGNGFGKVSVLRSYVVHPSHRARRLGEALVKAWFLVSDRVGRSLCLTEVLPRNGVSRAVFHSCGLHHADDAIHPYDGEPVMIFSRNLHTGGLVSRSTNALEWESS